MDERTTRMALSCVLEPATWNQLRAVTDYGAEIAWDAVLASGGPLAKKAAQVDLPRLGALAAAQDIRFVIPGDPQWPDSLEALARNDPLHSLGGVPVGLWVRGGGDLARLCAQSVAIVGSRAATAYGEHVASDLAYDLGETGVATVSGGAFGIDAAAHRGALASKTPTVCVLAGGVDVAYPPGNAKLFEHIMEHGVVVSELPPEEHPTRSRFLGRNRLIAALSQGTVMVEAGVRSGARNTLTWANCLGRPTMAVPGPVTSALSYGPHQVVRNAEAVLVCGADEVRELLGPLGCGSRAPKPERRPTDGLSGAELAVYEQLPARAARSADELALAAGIGLGPCLAALNSLADQGLVWQNPRREWQLTTRKQRTAAVA
ncbi:MAG: DNA-processing protein DprA [Propionibacteriaceae bacterium]|jgi:DNA processing protein|nr:DNA-processing protein DprA [Propionibacteriaceae bacterium]